MFDARRPSGWLFLLLLVLAALAGSAQALPTTMINDLTAAVLAQVTSTTVTVDAGVPPVSGGGIEVRWSDAGWGAGNDRNLVGRFATQAFTTPHLSRVQNCYLRQYDASVPLKYSRYTAALHLGNYPL